MKKRKLIVREREHEHERPGSSSLWTPEHVKMDATIAEYVRDRRERLHDVLRAAFDQALLLVEQSDTLSETCAEVLGALWVLCVTSQGNPTALEEPEWVKRRTDFERAARRFFDGVGAPRRAAHTEERTDGGYRPEDGDDMLRATARELRAHLRTKAGVTRELTQLIADSSPAWYEYDARAITRQLVHPRSDLLGNKDVHYVRDRVQHGLETWAELSKVLPAHKDREEAAMAVLKDILVDCGMPRKEAHNAVYAAESMKVKRTGSGARRPRRAKE